MARGLYLAANRTELAAVVQEMIMKTNAVNVAGITGLDRRDFTHRFLLGMASQLLNLHNPSLVSDTHELPAVTSMKSHNK